MYGRKADAKLIEATVDGKTHYCIKFMNGLTYRTEGWSEIKGKPNVELKQTQGKRI